MWGCAVKQIFIAVMVLMIAQPLAAQDRHKPIIPNLIAPDKSSTRIAVKVEKGLNSSKRLRSVALRNARTALHSGGVVSTEHLRALAQAGDGLAAQRYVRRIQAADTPAPPSDLAYFSAVAVGTGRIWTLGTMVNAMHRLDPATEPRERVRKYIKVLYPHAWAGNTLALQAVADFNGTGRLFGALSDRTRDRILAQSRKHGNGRIELGMAMGLLERSRAAEKPDPDDLAQARSLLKRAEASQHLAVATSAQNLLRLMDAGQTGDG